MEAAGRPEAVKIGLLTAVELPVAVRLIARAFRDNPLNAAVLAGRSAEQRLRSNQHGMRAHLPIAQAHGQVMSARVARGSLAAVLVAAPPLAYPFPRPPLVTRLRCAFGQGLRVAGRWGEVFAALDARHPREPHWYLATLGVDPARQRRGIGRALLERWLAGVDRDGTPAWLETDREQNLGFYRRAGFAVEDEIRVLGAAVWLMRREARRGFAEQERGGAAPIE